MRPQRDLHHAPRRGVGTVIQLEGLKQDSKHGNGFHKSEGVANANAWPRTKGHICISVAGAGVFRLEPRRIEAFWIPPQVRFTVHCIDGDEKDRTLGDQVPVKPKIFDCRPRDDRRWRKEAHAP